MEVRPGGMPVRAVAHDDLAAARTAHRVIRPAAAGGHPHHVWAVVGRRGHQYVIAVGHHHRTGVACQSGTQGAFDVVDLPDPVQLVTGQVEQDDHRRFDRVRDVRNVHLVDLEGGQRGLTVGCQGSDQSGVHIGALAVGGDGTDRRQRRRDHPGGGGLAVGAGDHRGAPSGAQLTQHRAVQGHRDQAADHGPGAASGDPGGPACGRTEAQCGPSSHSHPPGHRP